MLGCGPEMPASITVDCSQHSTQAENPNTVCHNNGIVGAAGVDPDSSAEKCFPVEIASGPWVRDDGAESGFVTILIPPDGVVWRFVLNSRSAGRLTSVEVPIRPASSNPIAPAAPASASLSRTLGPNGEWQLVAETADEPLDASYVEPRTLDLTPLDVSLDPDNLFAIRFQAPIANDPAASLILIGPPILSFECE